MLSNAQTGGAKPNAARRYAAVGWVGGVYPSAPFKARTAASDGHCAFTRAARSAGLRFAVRSLSEVTDRETTKSGACVGTSSTANAVPLPLVGEGLKAVQVGARLPGRTRHCPFRAGLTFWLETLREGERVRSSPHPPRSGPPSPRGEGLNEPDKGKACFHCRVPLLTIDY